MQDVRQWEPSLNHDTNTMYLRLNKGSSVQIWKTPWINKCFWDHFLQSMILFVWSVFPIVPDLLFII